MRILITIMLLWSSAIAFSQEIWQLSPWAPDSSYVIGAYPSGEPKWVKVDSLGVADSIYLAGDTIRLRDGAGVAQLPTASTSTKGLLTATDWNIFNDKIGGSGSTNYLAKFTSSNSIGTSNINDDGNTVMITNNTGGNPALIVNNNNTSHYIARMDFVDRGSTTNRGIISFNANDESFSFENRRLGGIGTGDINLKVNTGSTYTGLKIYGLNGNVQIPTLAGTGNRMVISNSIGNLSTQTIPLGTLTGVTASSPLFSSGGTIPNITIQNASGSQSGALTSTDWTIFNSKISGSGGIDQLAWFNGNNILTSSSAIYRSSEGLNCNRNFNVNTLAGFVGFRRIMTGLSHGVTNKLPTDMAWGFTDYGGTNYPNFYLVGVGKNVIPVMGFDLIRLDSPTSTYLDFDCGYKSGNNVTSADPSSTLFRVRSAGDIKFNVWGNGDIRSFGALYNAAGTSGTTGQVLTSQGLGAWTWTTLPTSSGSTEYLDPYVISSDTVGFILKNVMDTVQFIGVAGVTGESTTVSDSPTINMTLTGNNISSEVIDGSITPAKLSQTYLTSEIDGSTTNEIQTLSIAGNNLTISGAGGNTVTLPSGGGSSEWASLHYGSLAANTQTLSSSVWNTINFTGSSESNASVLDANHNNDEIEFVTAGTYRVDYRVSFIANADALIYSGIYSSASSSVDSNTQMESDTDSGYKHTIMQHSYIKTAVAGEKIKLQVQPLIAHTSVAIYSNFIVTKL
mgnify:CR=1 FL=1